MSERKWGAGHAGALVMHPVALALLAVALDRRTARSWGALALALVVRAAMVAAVARALAQPRPPFLLVIPRDLLSFAIHVASFGGRNVDWRGQRFRVTRGGRLVTSGTWRVAHGT